MTRGHTGGLSHAHELKALIRNDPALLSAHDGDVIRVMDTLGDVSEPTPVWLYPLNFSMISCFHKSTYYYGSIF